MNTWETRVEGSVAVASWQSDKNRCRVDKGSEKEEERRMNKKPINRVWSCFCQATYEYARRIIFSNVNEWHCNNLLIVWLIISSV